MQVRGLVWGCKQTDFNESTKFTQAFAHILFTAWTTPRNLRVCSSPPVSLCAMLPCFQGLLWLFQPDPHIVYNLFLIYQSLESLMSPQNAPSSLYLPHSLMGCHTWKWDLMVWDLMCNPWKWGLSSNVMSFAAQQLASLVLSVIGGLQAHSHSHYSPPLALNISTSPHRFGQQLFHGSSGPFFLRDNKMREVSGMNYYPIFAIDHEATINTILSLLYYPVLQALILTETNWSLSGKLTTLTLVVNLSLRLAIQQCLTKSLAGLGDFSGCVTPNPHSWEL